MNHKSSDLMEILNSKTHPPRLLNILHRKRLAARFNEAGQKKLILVTAGAGYGKTTLVSDALTGQDMDIIWYRLDTRDADAGVFMTYLESSLGQTHMLLQSNDKKNTFALSTITPLNERLLEFIHGLEKRGGKKTALVLDDYHLVQDCTQINKAVEFILERLPENICLVIISRKDPPIRISRLRVMERLLELKEGDLAFTSSEINDLYVKTRKLFVTEDHIKQIHDKTRGWAASLVLLCYTLKNSPPGEIKACLEQFKGSQAHIFSYLEENVFDTQPPEIQAFMVKLCLFSEIDATVCNRVFHMTHAEKVLHQMIADHLLIFPFDENAAIFYLHHLFRDFLLAKLSEQYTEQQIKALHLKMAVTIEPDNVFEGLHHYIEAQAFDEAVRLIQANEIKFLIEGKIHFLGKCLEKIPKKVIEKNPQLLFAEAKLSSYSGNPQDAIIKLKSAYKLFKKNKSGDDMVKCLVDLGSQYYYTGYIQEAGLLMEQVLVEVDKASPTFVVAMTYLIIFTAVLGDFEKSKEYACRAKEVISDYPDFERNAALALIQTSLTHLYYIQGDFHKSLSLNKKLLKSVLDLKIDACLPLVYYQYAATSHSLLQFEQGLSYAQKGIDICKKLVLQDSTKAWVCMACAQNCMGLGRLGQAIAFLGKSIGIFEIPGNRWGLANAWDCLSRIYLEQGKFRQAKKVLVRAMDIIDSYGLTITEGLLDNSMALVLIREKDFDNALLHLKRARPKIKHASFYLFENHMRTAKSYHGLKMVEKAIPHLMKGLEISREKDFFLYVNKEKKWINQLIGQVIGQAKLTTDQRLLVKDVAGKIQLTEPPILTLHLFGRFQVFAGRTKIASSQWKNLKALMILKYLAANRKAGFILREVLIEMLWPGEDLEKTGKRFNVAMSALRKILEPDIFSKAPSAYIIRKKDAYRLCPDKKIFIDMEHFLDQVGVARKLEKQSPQKAMEHYLAAESCYTGPFLEEDPYQDWCLWQRDHLNAAYLQVLSSLLRFYEAENKFDACVFYAKKILKTDPFDEAVVRKLMGYYAALGKRSDVKNTYDTYKTKAGEMNFPISPETKQLLKIFILH